MRLPSIFALVLASTIPACGEKDVDASGDDEQGEAPGDACDPGRTDEDPCADGLACEPTVSADEEGDGYVCAVALEVRGNVFDALDEVSIEGAHVAALDETGAPVSDVAVSDVDGNYVLRLTAIRDEDGEVTEALEWTLFATAQDYQPFPAGIRPSIPISAEDATEVSRDDDETGGDDDEQPAVLSVIENASTDVALLPLPDDQLGGRTVSGSIVDGNDDDQEDEDDDDAVSIGAGTLIVAEGGPRAPYTIADAGGHYTLFNVPDSAVTIVGYRQGLDLAPVSPGSNGDQTGVDLEVIADGVDALPEVSGSVNIVNAPGNSATSVVLVPVSVFNEALERGPVPVGLRAPEPPNAPSITSAFRIPGVPPGTYKVMAAFENDDLVRDPDEGIAGTDIQEVTVGQSDVGIDAGFKVTEDLAVVSPGAESPEVVEGTPVFVWADDSSEDGYEVVVYDAYGELVWEDRDVPRVTGNKDVTVEYGGPALTSGMYYQFRATSFKDGSAISRTEDLRGVFVAP